MSLQFTKMVTSLSQELNYRPISILSPFSKVLERLIYNQLYDFLEKHSILFQYQFGLRKGYSTEQAILEFYFKISYLWSLDFSKAFDTES